MKIYKGEELIASKVYDCKGFMSAIGLRFKSNFGKHDAYLIHMIPDSILDSFFVWMEFKAIWLDKDYNVLNVKNCKKNWLFPQVKNQHLVLELPISNKIKIKKGDKLLFKP